MRFDSNGQIMPSTLGYGSFITRPSTPIDGFWDWDWGTGVFGTPDDPGTRDLWGNALDISRANSPLSLADWSPKGQANNPCPPGWRVPSAAEFGDMHSGDGNDLGVSVDDGGSSGQHNICTLRDSQTGAVGGRILTNNDGLNDVSLFLPAVGWRSNSGGALYSAGTVGTYWSSTFESVNSRTLTFNEVGTVQAGSGVNLITAGLSVRCVSEKNVTKTRGHAPLFLLRFFCR